MPGGTSPQITAVLTTADGVSTVTETIFEKRMSHVPELNRMGAKIGLSGNSAIIEGATGCLSGVPVEASDLRCAAALVIAGLMARGETHVAGLEHLVRGYEDLPGKIASLGSTVRYAAADE